jgi:plastocyanin
VPAGAARKGAAIRAKGRWKRQFHRPGVYRYVCKVWSGMRGTVTVREKEPPPPPPES